jgi:hypothetical protein
MRGSINLRADHARLPSALAIGVGVALLASSCMTTEILTDDEPVTYSEPPEPRNECEVAFLDELTADIGIALSPPPTPRTEAVIRVMDACAAEELLAADEYLAYGVGQAFTRLRHHRLFNGPQRTAQLARLCQSDPYHSTVACRTLPAPGS